MISPGIAPGSWRAINLALLGIVALLTIIIALRVRTGFAWIVALTAVASGISMYMDLYQRELGERRE